MPNSVGPANGRSEASATLLGQGAIRIPTAGKIRAGLKVLTDEAAAHPQARSIYDRGLAAGEPFVQIEKALAAALPGLSNPLTPRNVSWFTVRARDFANPQVARQILDAHGEERGDGVRRLYRFPVVFPSDAWQVVMPHELVAWAGSEKLLWSQYSPDGRVRYCMQQAPVRFEDTGRRVIRVFGGRKTVPSERNAGLCDPESCPQYQLRQCNLSGRFLFFIPGIRSISAFELHTGSFYAMNAAIRKFELIGFMRAGRIAGFLDNKRTPFYLTKKLVEVSHIDEGGRSVRVPQWIIDLDADIDVTSLLRADEDEESVIVQAQGALRVLEGARGSGQGPAIRAELGLEGKNLKARAIRESSDASGRGRGRGGAPPVQSKARAGARNAEAIPPRIEQIVERARSYGIDPARYEVVTEAVDANAASPLAALKKEAAANGAEQTMVDRGWLPSVLRVLVPGAVGALEDANEQTMTHRDEVMESKEGGEQDVPALAG